MAVIGQTVERCVLFNHCTKQAGRSETCGKTGPLLFGTICDVVMCLLLVISTLWRRLLIVHAVLLYLTLGMRFYDHGPR